MFKTYSTEHVQTHLRVEFLYLVYYAQFVQLIPHIATLLCRYLTHLFGQCTNISFIDSTFLAVCDNRRIHQHIVFLGWAAHGRGSMGWWFGYKLHPVVRLR